MSDDRTFAALKALGAQELSPASDRAIRGRLEMAWTARPRSARRSIARRLAPALAAVALAATYGGAALTAAPDSPLRDPRGAFADVGAVLRAASTALLGANVPRIETQVPVVVPSPSATPPAAHAPSASPSHSASGVPVQLPPAASPTATRTASPSPARTVSTTPVVTPTPVASATRTPVTITGLVKDANGANVGDACISTSATVPTSTTQCSIRTTNGSYAISTTSSAVGQSITLYAYWTSPTGQLFNGSASGTMTAPTTVMPTITLTLRK